MAPYVTQYAFTVHNRLTIHGRATSFFFLTDPLRWRFHAYSLDLRDGYEFEFR